MYVCRPRLFCRYQNRESLFTPSISTQVSAFRLLQHNHARIAIAAFSSWPISCASHFTEHLNTQCNARCCFCRHNDASSLKISLSTPSPSTPFSFPLPLNPSSTFNSQKISRILTSYSSVPLCIGN